MQTKLVNLNMNLLLLTLLVLNNLVFPIFVISQNRTYGESTVVRSPTVSVSDLIEKSAEVADLEQDHSDLAEELAELSAHPLNLNAAGEEDLARIPFLTTGARKGLADYLKTYGEMLSVYELQAVQGFDSLLIRQILPFITILPVSHIPSPTPGNLVRFGHSEFLVRYSQQFPKSLGYLAADSSGNSITGQYYPGTPQKYYVRFSYTWFDKLRIGFAGEKDPGEQFFRGAQPNGMDYYAAYLHLSNIGILKALTIGNFKASFGQGLTMGCGISMGSVPGFAANFPVSGGIRPALSMNEMSYLRGMAVSLKIKHLEINGFVSYHPRDATSAAMDTITSAVTEISAFTNTGYHRTRLELAKREVVKELICGGNMNYTRSLSQQFGFKIGLTGVYSRYSVVLAPATEPYNRFGFHGNQNLNTGLDFQIRTHGVYFFGEIGRSLNGGLAWLAGLNMAPDSRVSLTMIYRNYQRQFQNLLSNAFGQNSINANERGIYMAINTMVNPKVDITGYIDLFVFPWLKYRVDAPSPGKEVGLLLGWHASRNATISLRFYQKSVRSNATGESNQIMHKSIDNLTRNYRIAIEWLPANGVRMTTRIESKEAGIFAGKRVFGYFLYQEVQIRLLKWLESIAFRFALFDIPDYATRIYVYEPDVLYGYSVPAYQGKGLRTSGLLKLRLSRRIDFWVRGGITWYSDRSEVGTGLDATPGNIRSELTGQLMIKL
ncbi:MAG: ComEA family DNA-binding protein [Bacteroidales bacterium]